MERLFTNRFALSLILLFIWCDNAYAQCPNITGINKFDEYACPCNAGNFSINFTNPGNDTLDIEWVFGDGTDTTISGVLATAGMSHTYTASGNYNVWIYVSGPGTCLDSISTTFSVTCLGSGGCATISYLNRVGISSTPFGSPCSAFEFWLGPCSNNVTYYSPGYWILNDTIPMLWDFGDGTTEADTITQTQGGATNHAYWAPGIYTITATFLGPDTCSASRSLTVEVTCGPPPCSDCIGSFAPVPGKKYLISAWVKEDGAAQSKTSYTYPSVTITYPSITGVAGPFYATGDIIDGWQRIEGVFTIPFSATDMGIKLDCFSGNCFFDDVRMFPFDGSMKSYVYDPINMRLVAELDERNYATLYEYDEEGKLIRVKKETEKGIMTIRENRNNTHK